MRNRGEACGKHSGRSPKRLLGLDATGGHLQHSSACDIQPNLVRSIHVGLITLQGGLKGEGGCSLACDAPEATQYVLQRHVARGADLSSGNISASIGIPLPIKERQFMRNACTLVLAHVNGLCAVVACGYL